jgi:hypothetical protein
MGCTYSTVKLGINNSAADDYRHISFRIPSLGIRIRGRGRGLRVHARVAFVPVIQDVGVSREIVGQGNIPHKTAHLGREVAVWICIDSLADFRNRKLLSEHASHLWCCYGSAALRTGLEDVVLDALHFVLLI